MNQTSLPPMIVDGSPAARGKVVIDPADVLKKLALRAEKSRQIHQLVFELFVQPTATKLDPPYGRQRKIQS